MLDTSQLTDAALEPGQVVRWRGRRWKVLSLREGGFLDLVGMDPVNRDQQVSPLLDLEANALAPDRLELPELDVASSDRAQWRALHLAHLTSMAAGREQLRGLDWGAVALEPYQVVPLMRVAKSLRPRLLIADDTGLGKTAEAGLALRWLAQRHQANRVLVITRASPEPERWRDELWTKFGFDFDILRDGADFNRRRRDTPTVNVFAQQNRMIVSMTLAARQALLDELRRCTAPFDVVIVDEAHHVAERGSRTKRLALLGRALSHISRGGGLFLLTATPHDGKTESFLSLLRLLDPLVEPQDRDGEVAVDVASRLVVRRLKPEVRFADGSQFLEPVIHVQSTLDSASKAERAVNKPLDAYLDWLGAQQQQYERAGARAKASGCHFLAGVVKKRFGSSVAALRATLRRRLQLPPAEEDRDGRVPYVDTDASDPEDEVIDPGAEVETPPPDLAEKEVDLARALLEAAEQVPIGRDSKLQALAELLEGSLADEKVVIFTEYRDTLRAAARRLQHEGIGFVTFHGATPDGDREEAIRRFNDESEVQVFLGTDAASEGQNLQKSASHLVHLDVPWNPNRYAQRNGRIDRYGQGRRPQIWVLVAADRDARQGRPEDRALELVIDKLNRIRRQLGSVNTVLPGFRTGRIRDVLVRGEDDAEEQLDRETDASQAERAHEDLTRLTLQNRREIEEARQYLEQLGTVDDFEGQLRELLERTFYAWDDGGALEKLSEARFRVVVPRRLREQLGTEEIPHATFRRDVAVGAQQVEDPDLVPRFLTPAHPLVDAVVRQLRDDGRDPRFPHRFDVEASSEPGLVLSFILRHVDGDGRTVEEQLEAVEVDSNGQASQTPERDQQRLGLHAPPSGHAPDAAAVQRWQDNFTDVVETARGEAQRRAERRRHDLVSAARELYEEELETLAIWRGEEQRAIDRLVLGSGQITFEAAEQYDTRMGALEKEYERRKALIADRTEVRTAGVELIGGRLYVEPSR